MHSLENSGSLPCTQQTVSRPSSHMELLSPRLPTIFLQHAFQYYPQLTNGLSPPSYLPKHFMHSSPPHAQHMCRSSDYPFVYGTNYVWRVHFVDTLIMRLWTVFCYCLPPRPKYSSQHHNRESPQSSLFPYRLRDHVTFTHSKRKLYSSAYFNVCPFDSRREGKRFWISKHSPNAISYKRHRQHSCDY